VARPCDVPIGAAGNVKDDFSHSKGD
jgi:hypothetical protein